MKHELFSKTHIVSFAIVLLLLCVCIPVESSIGSQLTRQRPASFHDVSLSQSLSLQSNSYEYFEIDSFNNNTLLEIVATSDAPISTAVMNSTQLNIFENSQTSPISDSLWVYNGTSVQHPMVLPNGQYFLVFYSEYNVNIQYGYEVFPNTPFSYGAPAYPLASGLAAFGIYNNSGVITPYEIKTNHLVGVANISSFSVNTANASKYGDSVTGATLQLNAMLVVQDSSSPQKVYWVQEVPDFTTGASQVSFGDEIWNFTDLTGFLSNETITSTNFQNGGFVYPPVNGSTYVYSYSANNVTYNLPLDFGLLINATAVPGTGVMVQLGYHLLSNGSSSLAPSTTAWFDNVTIVDPNVQSAYFDVAGNSTTPVGDFFDAELVFCGEGNLEPAYFTQLSAVLGLFYQNGSGALTSFPTYYSFSGDTGEAADNLVVGYSNGLAQVGTGSNPNYVYLGNASATLGPNLTIHGGTTGLTFSTITASNPPTFTTSSTNSGISVSSSASILVVGIVIVILIVLVIAVLATRRRHEPQQQYYPPVYSPGTPTHHHQIFCTNCGANLPEGSQYCGNCGYPAADSSNNSNSFG